MYVTAVRFRPVHLFLLIFQALWLNVIVPGHTRGIVQLPNAGHSCPACCCEQSAQTKNQKPAAPTNPPGNCAICFFAAHLSIPPKIDLSLTRLDFLHRLDAIVMEDRIARIALSPFNSRGPPANV
jgi:hypothetical protein